MSVTVRQAVIRVGLAAMATAALGSAAVVGGQAALNVSDDACQSTATKALTVVDSLRHPFTSSPSCR